MTRHQAPLLLARTACRNRMTWSLSMRTMTEIHTGLPDPSHFHVTRWYADGRVLGGDLLNGHDNTAITWIDLSAFVASTLSIDEILARVGPECPGLDHKMLEDLLTPDSLPGMTDYPTSYGGSLRKVSAFS